MAVLQSPWHYSGLILLFILLGTLREARAGQIHYSIPEELDKGSFVGNIARDLGLEPQELAERGVRIVSRGRMQLFALNLRSGSLVTAGRIDREELCAQRARCLVNFNILVEDKLNLFPVEVEIVDINDNAPRFLREELEVKIIENAALSSRFPLMEVYDPDVGVNSLQGFKLSENSHFSVEMPGKADGPKYPELVLERALDREEQAIHRLVLTATDGGDPARSSVVRILVTVLDANDNAPVFTQPVYRVNVPENLPVGTPVLSVNATDQDEGAHAEVTYSVVRITEKISKTFCLNVLTGEISTSAILDYEDTSFYELDIEARDRPGLQDRAKVLITILDVNDNVPEVVVTSGSRSVAESTPPGTVIILFQVYDRDSGLNGLVTCSISRSLPFELEKSVDNYYRLVTSTVLDRERVSTYNITVTATDKGMPPLSTEMLISLNVADINDNPPAFPHTSYSVYIPENNPRGASIFSVTAHDPDSRENAQVTYSLAEDTIQGVPLSSYISINSDTGILYALHSFDYEQFRDLQLRVIASDSGDPPLSSNVSLSIFVLDQNDNTPEILYPILPTDGSTGVELAPRSAEPGYLVTKVVAVDRDSGQNAWLSYRLLKASEPGLFVVGLHTGEVRTARALLDRDELKQSLVVAVQDHGQPPLSATVTLTVAVADSIPDVLADLGSLEVPHDSDASGLTLYLVVAVAAVSCVFLAFVIVLLALRLRHWHLSRLLQTSDSGLAGVPGSQFVGVDGVRAFLQTYSHEVSLTADSRRSHVIFPQPNYADTLISQESCGKSEPLLIQEDFCKEQDSAVQGFTQTSWHPEIQQEIGQCLKISRTRMAARQRGGDYRAFILLSILLGTQSEVWAGQILYSVPEETETGSFVGNIAKDLGLEPKDLAERGVRIVSRGRTQLFSLNPRSGNLVTAGRIDREELCAQSARCLVNFNILVEDKMNLYRIEVEIMDINDNSPKFLAEEMNVKIMENTAPGVRFPLNEARDPDVGTNSLQSYHLSPNRHFSLVVHTGEDGTKYPELVLEQVLDREEVATHHLLLTASDGGDPPRSGIARVQVTAVDVNDHAPIFSLPQYQVTVPENVPVGTRLLTINAVDLDEGVNGEVTYSFPKITPKILQIFQLNSHTGELSTLDGLDYEESGYYEMEVQAQDGPGSMTRAKVLITVLDVNDNAPEVTVTSVSSSIPEDTPPGTVVALFYLQDRDSGKNGQVTCTISEDLPFKLERSIDNYYRLVTAENLDREKFSAYNITLKATDGGSPPLSTTTHISMSVADTNDNPPAFLHSSYSVYVPENNPRGTSIFSVTAHDPDSNENARVTYSLSEDTLQGPSVSSYVSINSDTGILYALHSFDYEQFRDLQLRVTASDSGDPPLSSNVSLSIFVLDQNDNTPEILYPAPPTDGSTGVELAPRSAEPGYLVTKVVAVDRDSGQNAWLSYRLLKASEPGLFVIGLHTGEVRTARALLDRDALKQSLVVAVQDHGQPPLSATVTLTVAVANSIPDVLADLGSPEVPHDSDASGLTLYLVVAVAAVSCVFLAFVIVLLALRLRRWHRSHMLQASGGVPISVPASQFVGVDGVRAFLQTYSHEVSLTADSRRSHVIFPQPNYADTLISQESYEKKDPLLTSIDFRECKDEAQSIQCGLWAPLLAKVESLALAIPSRSRRALSLSRLASIVFPPIPPLEKKPCLILTPKIKLLGAPDDCNIICNPASPSRIPEEMPEGSVVGNLAKDLRLSVHELPTRKLRVSSEKPYFTVSAESGELLVSSRLDREQICGKKSACALEFEVVAENPLNFYHVNVEIEDVNDHTPKFSQSSFELQISESTKSGARFILGSAHDADIGTNSLQNYQLSADDHFSLVIKEKLDGSKYPELVLMTPLDREEQKSYHLTLTALDFGDPPLSSTAQIQVLVTDANDNPPVFSQELYRVELPENVLPGTTVLRVMATDQDDGVNAEITFSFTEAGQVTQFDLNSNTGEIIILNTLDFEEVKEYSIVLEAKDGGGMIAQCTVEIEVLDINDNAPEVIFQSLPDFIMEDTKLGTHIALLKIRDKDSGHNGEVICKLEGDVPFKILASSRNTYKLVTDGVLDRERTPGYNITITATDKGKPPLSSSSSITLHIGDVNDNMPVFERASYVVHVAENNPPGASITQVSASDPDLGPNGHVSYSIVASDLQPRALSSYVSVNPQSGVVFAQRAFDHEQLRAFELTLQARDHGSPALSSNVSLRVLVGDRNDNAPRVLYPALGPDGSALFDTVPRAAQPGYLVTKVVAVDADSGHNAWLSYHVLQASEPGLFSVGLRTGEVRTARALGDRDAARQRLLVAVRDGGQPPLSATATLLLVFADSLQEALPDLSDRPAPSDPQAELQFYLVVALALISVLFLLAVILAVALHLRRSSSPAAWGCFKPGLCVKSEPGVLPNYSEGTLPYSYNLCVAHTGKTEFNFLKCSEQLSSGQNMLSGDSSGALFPFCNSNESTSHQT
ncbi:hypothetical protein JEQ12_016896 [Ovis aries]|uniref:Cadherin domain-containing protein n=1 Tax=Ovis aries TaxID=9940 RepID=A0A836AHC7_SHEEP|nr:hypothetical protein JEQ12_016896 [Ovis aries]